MSFFCPLASVILPVRNEAPFIEETLRAVLAQDYPCEQMEVLVVDGMSNDGTREVVKRMAQSDTRVRLLDNPQRVTPAALNLGIRAARGEVIMRVDGHGVIPSNYVRECVTILWEMRKAEDGGRGTEDGRRRTEDGDRKAEGGAQTTEDRGRKTEDGDRKAEGGGRGTEDGDRKAEGRRQKAEMGTGRPPDHKSAGLPVSRQSSVVGSPSSVLCLPSSALRPLAVGGAWDCVGRGVVGAAIALATSSRFGVGGSRYRTCNPESQPVPTDSVPFWAMRREVFARLGLFREEMLCHEDYEFNYRLRQAGGTILLLPWLRSKYYVRPTLDSLARQYWRYGFWKGRFLCSHPGSLGVRHLIPPLFVALLAASATAAPFSSAGLVGFGLLLGLYGCFLVLATASLAGRASWQSAPLLPLVLATLHLCWGTGVWAGLLRGRVPGEPPRLQEPL